jgi:hypothetical protein
MFHLRGKTKDGRQLLAIGIPKKYLKGLTNAGMVLTLDAVIGAKMARADYVMLLQANSERELEQKLRPVLTELGGTVEDATAMRAGVIQEPPEEAN